MTDLENVDEVEGNSWAFFPHFSKLEFAGTTTTCPTELSTSYPLRVLNLGQSYVAPSYYIFNASVNSSSCLPCWAGVGHICTFVFAQ